MPRGDNLKGKRPDGQKGRSLGGKSRVRKLAHMPVDDSGRTHAQWWGMCAFAKLIAEKGEEGARRHMSELGVKSFAKERREYSRYLAEMRKS